MDEKRISERIWIASYIAGPGSCTLARGVTFRSIHDNAADAEKHIFHQAADPLTPQVDEYVLAGVAESQLAQMRKALELADRLLRRFTNEFGLNTLGVTTDNTPLLAEYREARRKVGEP